MRTAIISDIHGNRTAFEAVLKDLRQTAPDLVFHGGDLADAGSSPADIVDQVRSLGWLGVAGNTDEMLFAPESLEEFAAPLPKLAGMFDAIREMAAVTREALGEARLGWLGLLPRVLIHGELALVHASPQTLWRAPGPEASDEDLRSLYGPLGKSVLVYGHIHRSFVRTLEGMVVANAGSVSLSHDGDPRASYLLLDDSRPSIRRVEYEVEKEVRALSVCGLPHAGWVSKILTTAQPQMP